LKEPRNFKLYFNTKGVRIEEGDQIHLSTKQGMWTVKGFDFQKGYIKLGSKHHSRKDFWADVNNFVSMAGGINRKR